MSSLRTEANLYGFPLGHVPDAETVTALRDELVKPRGLAAAASGRRRIFSGEPDRDEWLTVSHRLVAYVSEGRWVCDCVCGNGVLATPGLEDVACSECGTVFPVVFPEAKTLAEAEAVLMQRPRDNRNWYPETETVLDLKAENAVHGFNFVTGGRV